jgi:hyperosmotically inducible periplasmic protein
MKPWIAGLLILTAACSNGGQQQVTHSDTYLQLAVKSKLATVDIDSTTAVGVRVDKGAVTLTGQARTPAERVAYVSAARAVDGVKSVTDRLTLNAHLQGIREQAADAALAARVSATIAAQAGINVFHVGVSARHGIVTLRGTVPRESIARTIRDTVRGVSGVTGVIDRIVVRS